MEFVSSIVFPAISRVIFRTFVAVFLEFLFALIISRAIFGTVLVGFFAFLILQGLDCVSFYKSKTNQIKQIKHFFSGTSPLANDSVATKVDIPQFVAPFVSTFVSTFVTTFVSEKKDFVL